MSSNSSRAVLSSYAVLFFTVSFHIPAEGRGIVAGIRDPCPH